MIGHAYMGLKRWLQVWRLSYSCYYTTIYLIHNYLLISSLSSECKELTMWSTLWLLSRSIPSALWTPSVQQADKRVDVGLRYRAAFVLAPGGLPSFSISSRLRHPSIVRQSSCLEIVCVYIYMPYGLNNTTQK